MKIWACAKDLNGFIHRDDGRYRLFFIWQVLKLKREQYDYFSTLEFFSTHSRPHKRRPMTPVKNGWFRYKDAVRQGGNEGGDGESISHAFVIAALAELETINFVFSDEVVPFKFTRLVAEEAEIKFGSGRSYYPDLYGEFTEDHPLYKQWGGRVAIEVWVEHQCERRKISDFESHGIPIIEIKVTQGLRVEQHIRHDDIEKSLEQCFERTKKILSERVFAKIISNPVSTAYHRESMDLIEKKYLSSIGAQKSLVEKHYAEVQQREALIGRLAAEKVQLSSNLEIVARRAEGLEEQLELYKINLEKEIIYSKSLAAKSFMTRIKAFSDKFLLRKKS